MNLAHMVGEHHYESTNQQLWHTITSWAGFVAMVILASIVGYIVYKHTRRTKVKEKIKK